MGKTRSVKSADEMSISDLQELLAQKVKAEREARTKQLTVTLANLDGQDVADAVVAWTLDNGHVVTLQTVLDSALSKQAKEEWIRKTMVGKTSIKQTEFDTAFKTRFGTDVRYFTRDKGLLVKDGSDYKLR